MSFQQIHTVLSIGLACEEPHTRILNVCVVTSQLKRSAC